MASTHRASSAPWTSRPWLDPSDLVRLQAALSTSWRLARPAVNATAGDLAWWQVLGDPLESWRERIRIWERRGEVIAYAWFTAPDELEWHQRADVSRPDRERLMAEAAAWAQDAAVASAERSGSPAPTRLTTWAIDLDEAAAEILRTQGWTPSPAPGFTFWYRRLDGGEPLAAPAVPPGYRIRHVRWPDDLGARVDVHRAAFAPSRMTTEKYARVRQHALYAPERDIVVEAPDGSLAAFALGWYDADGGVGLLEPVGAHPDHRRLGLARAACLAAVAAVRDAGAIDVLVLSHTDNAASEGLYASIGQQALTRLRSWTRPIPYSR
jgi:mycothiol synthase